MNPPKKLTSQQKAEQEQQSALEGQTEAKSGMEFSSVEEMLRHDAVHTPVPPNVSRRLAESINRETPPEKPWWKRWLK